MYEDLRDLNNLKAFMETQLEDYNQMPGLVPMSLVLFKDAIQHSVFQIPNIHTDTQTSCCLEFSPGVPFELDTTSSIVFEKDKICGAMMTLKNTSTGGGRDSWVNSGASSSYSLSQRVFKTLFLLETVSAVVIGWWLLGG